MKNKISIAYQPSILKIIMIKINCFQLLSLRISWININWNYIKVNTTKLEPLDIWNFQFIHTFIDVLTTSNFQSPVINLFVQIIILVLTNIIIINL